MVKEKIIGLLKQGGGRSILSLLDSIRGESSLSEDDFIERRNSTRLRLSRPVIINSHTDTQNEVISNLSPDGLRVKSSKELVLKKHYGFEFALPNGPRVELEGEIRWRKAKGRSVYYGVKFDQDIFSSLKMKHYVGKLISDRKKELDD
jgi:hypothetical protein